MSIFYRASWRPTQLCRPCWRQYLQIKQSTVGKERRAKALQFQGARFASSKSSEDAESHTAKRGPRRKEEKEVTKPAAKRRGRPPKGVPKIEPGPVGEALINGMPHGLSKDGSNRSESGPRHHEQSAIEELVFPEKEVDRLEKELSSSSTSVNAAEKSSTHMENKHDESTSGDKEASSTALNISSSSPDTISQADDSYNEVDAIQEFAQQAVETELPQDVQSPNDGPQNAEAASDYPISPKDSTGNDMPLAGLETTKKSSAHVNEPAEITHALQAGSDPTTNIDPSAADAASSVGRPTVKSDNPRLQPYTEEEWAELAKLYSPAQLEVIRMGEEAVDLHDLEKQGMFRTDPYGLDYSDDLAKVDPILDFVEHEALTSESKQKPFRFKRQDEIQRELATFLQDATESTTGVDFKRFVDNMQLTAGAPQSETNPTSYLAQPIPKGIPSLEAARSKSEEEEVPDHLKLLMRQTGLSQQEIRGLRTKTLVRHRVVNQTRLGKIDSMYVLTIAGNGKGMLGIGEGKSSEILDAGRQAQYNAIRNMQPVLRYEQRTIFGAVRGKSGAVELELRHRSPGYGLRCQHLIFEMCRCAGIADITARVTRARNKMNVVKATFKALLSQRDPEDMARGLGRKLVDVRKVYYGGNVS